MRKIAYIVLGISVPLTALLIVGWIAGFVFAPQRVGTLIHILLVLASLTSIAVFAGVILLIVSLIRKK